MLISEIEPWLLSGQPVVRLQWRDYGDTVEDYRNSIYVLAKELKLGVAILELKQVPGVIVQAFLGDTVPQLVEPKLSVTRRSMPYLFCAAPKCAKRVPFPGEECSDHQNRG